MILDGLDKIRQKEEEQKEKKCKSPIKYKDAISAKYTNMHYSSGKDRRRKYVKSNTSASEVKQPLKVYKADVDVELDKMKGELIIYGKECIF